MALGGLDFSRRLGWVAWALLLPGFLAGGTMVVLGHILWPRFFFFRMGFGLLLAMHGVVTTARLVQRRTIGSPRRLKLVLTITGQPVRSLKRVSRA